MHLMAGISLSQSSNLPLPPVGRILMHLAILVIRHFLCLHTYIDNNVSKDYNTQMRQETTHLILKGSNVSLLFAVIDLSS